MAMSIIQPLRNGDKDVKFPNDPENSMTELTKSRSSFGFDPIEPDQSANPFGLTPSALDLAPLIKHADR